MDDASAVALRDHLTACMGLPRRGIRFAEAIFALTGCKVIPFDPPHKAGAAHRQSRVIRKS